MEILRTPDRYFEILKDYPFKPHYTEIDAFEGRILRIHHLDEGEAESPIVLCLHGQPSWSYLYRKMVPYLVSAGLRVLAPDLPGYGKSDKPAAREDYTYQRQVDWMGRWLVANNLSNVNIFGQDWGGLIGLRLVADYPDRFARVIMGNTGLPYNPDLPGDVVERVARFRNEAKTPSLREMAMAVSKLVGPEAFAYWQKFCWETEDIPVGLLMSMMIERLPARRLLPKLLMHRFLGKTSQPPKDLAEAYEAPFPDPRYKMGVRAMPSRVPTLPTDPSLSAQASAWDFFDKFEPPFLCLFTADDPITRGLEKTFINRVPGARGLNHQVFPNGGHFLQEHRHKELCKAIVQLIFGEPSP